MVQNLLTVADFDAILDDYFGQQISHTPVTRSTSNISGKETLSDGSASNIKAYFVRVGQNYDFVKAGFVERGDAVMLAKVADSVSKDDKITYQGSTYRVKEAFDVQGIFDSTGSNDAYVYTACNLFLIS